MLKRSFDIVASAGGMVFLSPLMLLAAIGIKFGSPGPVIYRAKRAGLDGRLFTMHKFRTMHVRRDSADSVITAPRDTRVFPFGGLLRKLKIDELPQLWDVFRGEMSIVGPRPEDPKIVEDYYTPAMRETLTIRPGLASPGSLFGTTHGGHYLNDKDPEGSYAEQLLPVKLAIEQVYVRNASFGYDLQIILRTIWLLAQTLAGRRQFPDPAELAEASKLLQVGSAHIAHTNMPLSGI
jgi:lipopolysaccharide/colanic/teichoic acid biosynthesis glycosyltransferase